MAPINIVIISSAVIVGAAVFLLRYHFFGWGSDLTTFRF
jgi:hypothetical protein